MYYLDTSVFLEWLFKENSDKYRPPGEQIVSSDLLRVESRRTFHRLRLENKIDDSGFVRLQTVFQDFWHTIHVVSVDEAILELSAGTFPTIIGTLDAIHLSTALLYQKYKKVSLTIITEDKQLRTTAQACGFTVVDHTLQQD